MREEVAVMSPTNRVLIVPVMAFSIDAKNEVEVPLLVKKLVDWRLVLVALVATRLVISAVAADSSVEKNEVEVPLSAKKLVAYRLVEVLFVEATLVVK